MFEKFKNRIGSKKSQKQPSSLQTEAEALIALKHAFEELHIMEFINYLQSPWRMMWYNFVAGIFRGLGTIVGMTVVFAGLIWLLSTLVDFPLIGEYFLDLKQMLEQFSKQTTQSPHQ